MTRVDRPISGSGGMDRARGDLLDLINKRITLNVLIQGAAMHTVLTAHHLVDKELRGIDADLLPLYDKMAAAMAVYLWRGEGILFTGRPMRFWKRVHRPDHPFHRHPLLARHGATLAAEAKRHALQRARQKGACRLPVAHSIELPWLLVKLLWKERKHRAALERLARRATRIMWGIPEDRLEAKLTMDVAFGRLRKPDTTVGTILRASAVAYGGVVRDGARLRVVARGHIWPFLSHELVKGTAELVCLHGLNTLDRATYMKVTDAADRIEYEPWHLQVGPELWRRLLPLIPDGRMMPRTLMHIARLPPRSLEHLMMAVVEEPAWARELIAALPCGPENG